MVTCSTSYSGEPEIVELDEDDDEDSDEDPKQDEDGEGDKGPDS